MSSCQVTDALLSLNWSHVVGDEVPELPDRLLLNGYQTASPVHASDELWHTAINGRGAYLNIYSEETANNALPDFLETTTSMSISTGMTVTDEVYASRAVIY